MGGAAARGTYPGVCQRPPYNMTNCRRSRSAHHGAPIRVEDPSRCTDTTVFANVVGPGPRPRPRVAASGLRFDLCRGRRSLQPANECHQVRARRLHHRADQVGARQNLARTRCPLSVDPVVASTCSTSLGERNAGGTDWRYLRNMGTALERSREVWPHSTRNRSNSTGAPCITAGHTRRTDRWCAQQ